MTAKRITARGTSSSPEVADLTAAEQPDYDARLAQAPVMEAADLVRRSNRDTLHGKAQQALADNAAYLGNPSPSPAQVANQVARLTRQQTALIRLLTGALDSTAGT